MELPPVVARLTSDTRGFSNGVRNAERELDGFGKSASRSSKVARGAFDDLASSLTGKLGPAGGQAKGVLDNIADSASGAGGALSLGLAAGAAAAGAALVKFATEGVHEFVSLANEVRKFREVSGATAEESSRFVAALDDLGVSSERGAKAVFMLGRQVAENRDDLKALGVEIAHTKGGTVDLTETLLNVADAYVRTHDPAKRAELVMRAFGRSGQDLIPVLEQGRAGLQAFFEGAEGGRQIFSDEDLRKARQFELAVDELSDTFRGLKMEAGEALLPYATGAAKAAAWTLELADRARDFGSNVLATVTGGLSRAIEFLGRTSNSQDDLASKTRMAAEAALDQARKTDEQRAALDRLFTAQLGFISGQLALERSTNNFRDRIAEVIEKEKELTDVTYAYGPASEQAQSAANALRDAKLGVREAALQAASAALKLEQDQATLEGRTLSAQEKQDIFRAKLIDLADQAEGPTRDAILALAGEIRDLPDSKTVSIYANTQSAEQAIARLSAAIDAISNRTAQRGVAAAAFGAYAVNPQGMQHGGPVRAGSTYLVGEAGPELLHMGTSGYVTPNHRMVAGGTVVHVHIENHGSVITERELMDSVAQGLRAKSYTTGDFRFAS